MNQNQNQTPNEDLNPLGELRNHLGTMLRYWWLIVFLPIVGGSLGYYYSSTQATLYEAGATILVQYRGSGLNVGVADSSKSRELSKTYRRLILATPFLERIELFGASVSATTGVNPPTINIGVRHGNPASAATVAQSLSESFIDYAIELRLAQIAQVLSSATALGITDVQNVMSAQFSIMDNLILLEPVSTPGSPILPRTRRNTQIGIFLGIVTSVGFALLLNSFRETVRSPEDLERRFGSINLGVIQMWTNKEISSNSLVIEVDPKSNYSESYRKLRSSLQFANSTRSRSVIMIASPSPGEGKSTVLTNLAIAERHAGRRVLVVDADLRRPTIQNYFNIPRGSSGLSNYLSDPHIDFKDVVTTTESGVDVLSSGPIPPNPAELLGSPKMKSLVNEAKATYDIVLVDSPPLLVVADAPIIASQVEGLVIVVDAFHTRPNALRGALRIVGSSGGDVVGVVINKHKKKFMQTGYYYAYYDYEYDSYLYENGADNHENRLKNGIKKIWSRQGKSK